MVDSSQWMVWLFRPTDAGSSVVDDPTRAPEDICAPEPVSPRAAPAAAKCGACGYQKTLEAGKTHYWSICKLVVDRMQCPAALPVGHKFYTGAGCGDGKCPCRNALRCILTLSWASPFSFSRAFLWLFFPAFFQVQEVPQARAQPANNRAGPPAF